MTSRTMLWKKRGAFSYLGVQLAVDKDASVNILLCAVAESLVFCHDKRVHFTGQFEVGVRGVPVSVDFIGHCGFAGTSREELLDHD